MNVMTHYGTESIELDFDPIPPPTKSYMSTPWCFFTEKMVYISFTILSIVFLVLYMCSDTFIGPKEASPLSQMKLIDIDSIHPILDNCANEVDMSCDMKYGCISYELDIQAVLGEIEKKWESFAEYIADQTSETLQLDGCIATKLSDNHLVCSDQCESLGYILDVETPNLCKNTFLDEMKTILMPYRRACIASLLGHQFAEMCGRKHNVAKAIEIASFTWWTREYSVGPTFSHYDCPYYI